jgi:hypothetical protein
VLLGLGVSAQAHGQRHQFPTDVVAVRVAPEHLLEAEEGSRPCLVGPGQLRAQQSVPRQDVCIAGDMGEVLVQVLGNPLRVPLLLLPVGLSEQGPNVALHLVAVQEMHGYAAQHQGA